MTHKRANISILRFVCLFLFTVFLASGLVIPQTANACTCYSGDTEKYESANSACQQACSDATATEGTTAGECTCADGSIKTISCEAVCSAADLESISATKAAENYAAEGYISPELEIEIPGVVFTKVLAKDGHLEVSWLGEYISGVYLYLISIGTIIAIVFIMIGGLQYTIAGGYGETSKAKKRIKDAVIGLVLLMSVYLILWIVNPNLTFFDAISLIEVSEMKLDAATMGDEGASYGSVSRETCDEIVATAKSEGECKISQAVTSPTGGQASCGVHHWFDYGANGEYKKITNLDYSATWGDPVLAPFDGIVTYAEQSSSSENRCGNRIYLNGTGDAAGASITICHAKDFVNDAGVVLEGSTVAQGDVIGHVGGNCCTGESPPRDWSSAKKGWCKISGTPCTDPSKLESCQCQPYEQAGNTSGPHVHMTWNSGGDLLSCLDY